MKKSKFLVLTVVLIGALSIMLGACSAKAAKPKNVLVYGTDITSVYQTAAQLPFASSDVDASGNLVLIRESDSSAAQVFNLKTNKTVYTARAFSSPVIKIYTNKLPKLSLFTVSDNGSTCLYDENRDLIATASEENAGVKMYPTLDIFVFDGICYRISDGAVYAAFSLNGLKDYDFDKFSYQSGKYYYASLDPESGAEIGGVAAYDDNFDCIAVYRFPSYAEKQTVGYLSDGKLLIQYSVKKPDDEKKFDYYSDNKKYDLETKLFDVKKNKVKDISFDYYLLYAMSGKTFETLSNGFFEKHISFDGEMDFAVCYEISDKNIDTADRKILTVNKKGKITSSITDMYEDMIDIPVPMIPDRYCYTTANKQKFLLNGKGKHIGEITNVQGYNDKYLWTDEAIYDYDLNMLYSLKNGDLSVYGCTTKVLLLQKNASSDVYVFDGSLTLCVQGEDIKNGTKSINVSPSEKFFIITDTSAENPFPYAYYNAESDLLVKTASPLTVVTEDDDYCLLCCVDSTMKKVYYRFA